MVCLDSLKRSLLMSIEVKKSGDFDCYFDVVSFNFYRNISLLLTIVDEAEEPEMKVEIIPTSEITYKLEKLNRFDDIVKNECLQNYYFSTADNLDYEPQLLALAFQYPEPNLVVYESMGSFIIYALEQQSL